MESNRGEDHQHERSSLGFINYLNRQSEWLEKTKGNMIVAATVIASMSFQVMANPPGGVWQSDDCPPKYPNGTIPVCKAKAGTSVLAHAGSKRIAYLAMVISSTVSFSASMSIILLAISGLRLTTQESDTNGDPNNIYGGGGSLYIGSVRLIYRIGSVRG